MAKRLKLSSCQFDELPDEVILKIVGFLDLKELLLCGQVSMRLRAITKWIFAAEKFPMNSLKKQQEMAVNILVYLAVI